MRGVSLSHKPTRDKWRASPLGRFHSMNKLSITGMNSSSSSDEIPLLLKDSQTHPLNSHAVQHERSGAAEHGSGGRTWGIVDLDQRSALILAASTFCVCCRSIIQSSTVS